MLEPWDVTYRGTVYPWHCDHMGHMNVMWYVGKFDEATWQLFSAIGLTPDRLRANGRGLAAVDQRISYRREVRAGDVVLVRSALLEVRSKVIRFCHRMEDAATGEISRLGLWSWVYHKQKTAEGNAITPAYVDRILDEEAAKVSKIGASVEKAKRYIADQVRAPAPDEFLTTALYSHLPHQHAPARI